MSGLKPGPISGARLNARLDLPELAFYIPPIRKCAYGWGTRHSGCGTPGTLAVVVPGIRAVVANGGDGAGFSVIEL